MVQVWKKVDISALIWIVFISTFFTACQTETTGGISLYREKLHNAKLIDSLDNLALNQGDTLAYIQLREIHDLGEQRLTGFLFYALVMSNKHHYRAASQDVYDILKFREQVLDSATLRMADEYLSKSN
jgi:hypothetical protein